METNSPRTITAVAPGKAILIGEHAINRGQPALAAGVGLTARCTVTTGEREDFRFRAGMPPSLPGPSSHTPSSPRLPSPPDLFSHAVGEGERSGVDSPLSHSAGSGAGGEDEIATRQEILALARRVDDCRAAEDYEAIRRLSAEDYFAPAKYVLASAFGDALPDGLDIAWESEIPPSSGLGSGGAAFTALVAAIAPLFPVSPTREQRAEWAHRGDIIAHGGIASALDTQTSLLGGVIRFTGKGLAAPVPCAPGLSLVIGNTGVVAATSEVNSKVRRWLAARPQSRMACFEAIGALSRAALPLLQRGDWPELGRLFTLNQLALEKIGVSCPEIENLIDAALGAGAFGAKLSGSGGGGIVLALVSPETRQAVADAITHAGGTALTPAIGVPGVQIA